MRTRLFTILVCLYMGILSAEGAIRYVRMGGTGGGTSWSDASGNLQDMIDASLAGDEIWVTKGTYRPTRAPIGCTNCLDSRDWTFFLKSGVQIYGGFAGVERSRSGRDFRRNMTFLSGDIGVLGNSFDNTYHVIVSISNTPNTKLDGFTIRDGNANGGGAIIVTNSEYFVGVSQGDAGGILNLLSNASYDNLIITNNSATVGGGFYCLSSSKNAKISLKNSFIVANNSTVGGGIRILDAGCAVEQCVFINNTSEQGNDIAVALGSIVIKNSTFIRNSNNNINSISLENNITADCVNTIFSYPNEPIGGWINITYSLSPTSNYGNETNILGSPTLVNAFDPDGADDIYGTSDDGLRLQFYSAGVDVGLNTPDIAKDLAGQPRQVDVPAVVSTSIESIDMGAYESQSQIFTIVTTPASCPDGHDGKVSLNPTAAADLADGITLRFIPVLESQSLGMTNVGDEYRNLQAGEYIVQAIYGNIIRASVRFALGSIDQTLPTITCPADVTLTTPSTSCEVPFSYSVTASDECTSASVVQTRGLSSGSTFPLGTTINTFYAYDEARNESVPCSFAVTVQDLTRPTIQVQDLIVVPANAACEAVNVQLPQPTVADNCTATTDLVVRNNAPLVFPLGSTKVKWTVKDASGNEATAETEVVVADKTLPTILPLSPISVEANMSNCRATVILERPLVQDNCTQENITISNDAPAVFPLGETTVTWTVKDRVGNIATATQVVTVTKSIQPLTLVLKKDPNCNATASGELRVITTGAGNVVYSIAPNVGAQPFAGRFINLPARANYRITARDANGCTETFNSGLVQPPALVLSTPQTTPLLCRGGVDGTLSVSATGGTPDYTYTISPNTYAGFSAPGHFVGLRAGNYTVSVTDANGCIATQPATITQPARLLTMRPPVITNVACPDGREGRIVVSAQGGVGAFTYTLFPMPAGAVQRPVGTFTNLGAGTYSVLASDANNCSISVPVTIIGPTIEPNKCYSVVNVQSNLALAVPTGQTANNLQALQVATNASSAEQLWRFPTAANNTRKMIVQQAGKYLSNTVNTENAPAFQAANATNGSRDWELICLGSGAYFIKNKLTGKLLSVENAVTTPNAKIVVKSLLTNSKSQEWRLEEAACPNNNSLTGDVPETTASDETNTSFAEVLFPNPANEEVSIDLTAFNNTKVQVSIVDLTGKILSYQTVVGGIVHKERLESYVSGHYIVKVAVEGGETEVFQLKIVKQ